VLTNLDDARVFRYPILRIQIFFIPKQFLKSIKRSGFGVNLFDEWRYLDHGEVGMDNTKRPLNNDFASEPVCAIWFSICVNKKRIFLLLCRLGMV
jgi:hypothetical protein